MVMRAAMVSAGAQSRAKRARSQTWNASPHDTVTFGEQGTCSERGYRRVHGHVLSTMVLTMGGFIGQRKKAVPGDDEQSSGRDPVAE